ncbi:MAG: pyruvate, phosphate dikinase [Acholeplasmatales bacterium]|nr:MAG: pyruvate, phosphate dikinase [Acholeplasmatales bacterium]
MNKMKRIYMFGEGNQTQKDLLGGKGANLSEMKQLGIPVPAGFTVTTAMCNEYYDNGGKNSQALLDDVLTYVQRLEEETGKTFGTGDNPLLVSVRSGAKFSMPGMMDTILNLGMNDTVIDTMIKKTNNPRFVYDLYRRLIQMFAEVVLEVDADLFEHVLDDIKEKNGFDSDTQLNAENWKTVCDTFLGIYEREVGQPFPQDPMTQLYMSIDAVFRSWDTPRARIYRNHNKIAHDLGTAVNVQEMVFGNTGENSGTGVLFTRNPKTGEKRVFGEFLFNAQGEDIVAGIRTPLDLDELDKARPELYKELTDILDQLEHHYKEMQDVEFTIEEGVLHILQTRTGKRTAQASVKIAVDLVQEGLITQEQALLRVDTGQIDQLLHPVFEESAVAKAQSVAKGLAASPGAATGRIVFSSEQAVAKKEAYGKVLLFRKETSPEDIEGMIVAEGFVTQLGGMTSHAAVVARGMGKCCVSGVSALSINESAGTMTINGQTYKEGEYFSIDGTSGLIYPGKIDTKLPEFSPEFEEILGWAKAVKRLGVKTNADNERDSLTAIKFGAEGIGLTRTEHMFFDDERILNVREMIIAETKEEREKALEKLLPHQLKDFKEIFKVMDDKSVTIRLLDPPLHEFLPQKDEVPAVAKKLGVTTERLDRALESLHEFNPMLGHRGCRLAVTYPEITVMQVKAIILAAIEMAKQGIKVKPEIMIPLISTVEEFTFLKKYVVETADALIAEHGADVTYLVGTMIETPRAALVAGEVAKEADFFSFGTNDLTQMTYGFSRDDAGKFLHEYQELKFFESDPFVSVDQTGVGELVKIAAERGLAANPNLILGICGEHGGDPESVEFFHRAGLTYVSCSPFRIPLAIIAAAQAQLKYK